MFAIMNMKNTPSYFSLAVVGATTTSRRTNSGGVPSTKRILRATTAAAAAATTLGTLSGSCWAFTASPPRLDSKSNRNPNLSQQLHSPNNHRNLYHHHRQQSRLFFSQKGGDDNKNNDNSDWETFKRAGANLLAKGVEKVKSLLPFGGGGSDQSDRAEIIKRERKEEISGGINALFKDLPLPIRMMGRMVSPLLARAADEIAEQSQQAQDVFEEARFRLIRDPYIAESLGEPLQVGQPFSQSSSTVVINGQRSATVRASFPVAGTRGSGIATLESNNGDIRSLTVNVNGRTFSVGSSTRGGSRATATKLKEYDSNIIEAEIIEKKK